MTGRRVATKDELESYLNDHSNWGRWGEKGGAGAMNLITPEKRRSRPWRWSRPVARCL